MREPLFTIAAIITAAAIGPFPAGLTPAGHLSSAGTREAPRIAFALQRHPGGNSLLPAASSPTSVQETVVLLNDYDDAGATGLVINRPSKMPLADMIMPMRV
jgi:hypothetical protein